MNVACVPTPNRPGHFTITISGGQDVDARFSVPLQQLRNIALAIWATYPQHTEHAPVISQWVNGIGAGVE